MSAFSKFVKFLTKYVTIWVILCAIIAYFFPTPFKPYGGSISYALGIIMLSMGLSMTPNDFKLIFSRPKDVIIGVVTLYIFMPLVGLGIGKALGLAPMLVVGFVLLGCCPTGTTSNVMTLLAKGDKALSVTISSISTIIAPFIMPALLLFYAGCAFAFFLVLPMVFGFLTKVTPAGVAMMTDISAYLDFVLVMFLAFGLSFELPVALVLLTLLGWVTPAQLREGRGYAVVGNFVIAAVVTPPDVVSQLMLAIPMCLLYEAGILAARLVAPKPATA